ncbi:MAG: type II toxin-antitoxin system PemK/MazF family toxin [Bdellovibrionota bacterium]
MKRGEVWWANLPSPSGSEPGYPRPVVILQADDLNQSKIQTVIVAILTTRTRLGAAPGNVSLPRGTGGLSSESVINLSQVATIDRRWLRERLGMLSQDYLIRINAGLQLILGLD